MQTERRSMQDRRSGKDRRKLSSIKKIFFSFQDRHMTTERRQAAERRWGWVRMSKWSSVYLASLKLAKFLQPSERNNKHGS